MEDRVLGDFDRAQYIYDTVIAQLADLRTNFPEPVRRNAADLEAKAVKAFGQTIASAQRAADAPCPLLAAKGGGHPGLIERINRFRPK